MKKILILLSIILLCVLTVFTVLKGIHIGDFSILGIYEIQDEDAKLDKKVKQATKLASTDYKNQMLSIEQDVKDMQEEKQKYEDEVAASTESEFAAVVQKQKYSIDKLWTKIGTLATDEGLDAKFVYKKGTLQAAPSEQKEFNYYTIEFEVTGSYIGVSLYISDLEDDSELGFKIEDFKMKPEGNGDTVKATFTVKDIAIMGLVDIAEEEPEEEESNTTNTTEEKKSIINAINTTVDDVTAENTANVTRNSTSQ